MSKVFVFSLLLIASALKIHAQSAAEWKTYTSRDGKFTILLPGEPTTGYRPIDMDSPNSVTYVINLQTPSAAYIIAYFDLPAAPSDSAKIKKTIDDTRDRIVKMYSLKLESESDIESTSYPGSALKMKTPDGKEFLSRIFLVSRRVYHISIVLLSKEGESSNMTRYFDSFKPIPLTDEEIKNLPPAQGENEKAIPGKIRVSEEVLQHRATKKVQPTYPVEARKAGISGVVQVRVSVSEQGQVMEAEALSGPEQLREFAVDAARQWIFKPMTIGRYPVKIDGVLVFNFKK